MYRGDGEVDRVAYNITRWSLAFKGALGKVHADSMARMLEDRFCQRRRKEDADTATRTVTMKTQQKTGWHIPRPTLSFAADVDVRVRLSGIG